MVLDLDRSQAHDLGEGADQDRKEAAKWYRKAAEQGMVEAQIALGELYCRGEGAEQNIEEGIKWLRIAAEQGDVWAQYILGSKCEKFGTEEEAAKWYRKAAEQGLVNAQYQLGWCYEYGRGVRKNSKVAIKWYRKAAEQGDTWAQDSLRTLELREKTKRKREQKTENDLDTTSNLF